MRHGQHEMFVGDNNRRLNEQNLKIHVPRIDDKDDRNRRRVCVERQHEHRAHVDNAGLKNFPTHNGQTTEVRQSATLINNNSKQSVPLFCLKTGSGHPEQACPSVIHVLHLRHSTPNAPAIDRQRQHAAAPALGWAGIQLH